MTIKSTLVHFLSIYPLPQPKSALFVSSEVAISLNSNCWFSKGRIAVLDDVRSRYNANFFIFSHCDWLNSKFCDDMSVWRYACVTKCLCDKMSMWRKALGRMVYVTKGLGTNCVCDVISCEKLSTWRSVCWQIVQWQAMWRIALWQFVYVTNCLVTKFLCDGDQVFVWRIVLWRIIFVIKRLCDEMSVWRNVCVTK